MIKLQKVTLLAVEMFYIYLWLVLQAPNLVMHTTVAG